MDLVYHFGGIEIRSDIPFDRLRPACPSHVVRAHMIIVREIGAAPDEQENLFNWPGRFGMRLGVAQGAWRIATPTGVYLVQPDASVVRMFSNQADETLLKDLFVRRLLPRLVKLKGGFTYHAASLARDGKGILLMGPSGAGKSTMSVGLSIADGWSILGDDMALAWNEGEDIVTLGGADVGLWPFTSRGLSLPEHGLKCLLGYDGKKSYEPAGMKPVNGTDALSNTPIRGVFFLDRTDCPEPRVEKLDRKVAMEKALRQIVLFNPNGSAGLERVQSVTRLNAMLATVPAWMLSYPPSFSTYAQVSETITAALEA
nr:hypothetical protein [uncultured Rhodoferax sp.]